MKKRILLISLLFSFTLLIAAGLIICNGLENEEENFYKNPWVRQTFNLDNKDATYKIIKSDDGLYLVEYVVGKGYAFERNPNVDDTRHAYIGSSKANLEEFIGQSVKITGKYRETFGTPLCWKEGCLEHTTYGANKELVADIENLEKIPVLKSPQ